MLLFACRAEEPDRVAPVIEATAAPSPPKPSNYELANRWPVTRKGRWKTPNLLDSPLVLTDKDTLFFPPLTAPLIAALKNNRRLLLNQLEAPDTDPYSDETQLAQQNLLLTELLLESEQCPGNLARIQAWQSWGEDQGGNVLFTGYYTPLLSVKALPDATFRFPIYRRPKRPGPYPTRAQIQAGALAEQQLEIAWTDDPIGLYYMHIQGSGYVQFQDLKKRRFLRFNGTNQHRYRSIELILAQQKTYPIKNISISGIRQFFNYYPYLQDSILALNPSYTFFTYGPSQVIGAPGIPLVPHLSCAVDTRYFPLGTIFLAAIPVYDKRGKIKHHTFTYLLAQDTGGAIKGPGHIDIYSGVGQGGQQTAMFRHHYGRLWVLNPAIEQPILD